MAISFVHYRHYDCFVFTSSVCILAPPLPIYEIFSYIHKGADKSLARPTSRCILFDGENISFDASLVIYVFK